MTGLLPPWGSPEGECDDAGEDPAAQRIAGFVGPLGHRVGKGWGNQKYIKLFGETAHG